MMTRLNTDSGIAAINQILNIGVIGALFILMLVLVVIGLKHMFRVHQEERKEWKEQSDKQFAQLIDVAERHTAVSSRIETTLGSIERRLK